MKLEEIHALRAKPWTKKDFLVPQEVFAVPGMLSDEEKRMLYYLALKCYSGEGMIADMGAFLGGSTVCFAAALRQRFPNRVVVHSYDLFKLGDFERQRFFADNPPEGLRTRLIFDQHLRNYSGLLAVHEGDVLGFPWIDGPIEVLFVDIAKSYKVFDHLLLHYFPAMIPLRSVLILQDYLWGTAGPWHHVVMEKLNEYYDYIADTNVNSVVFLLKHRVPERLLQECLWAAIPLREKLELMDRAIDRLDTEKKKDYLRQSRGLLVEGKDKFWGLHYHQL